MKPDDLPLLIPITLAADLTGISRRTLTDWCRKNHIKAYHNGGYGMWRIPRREFLNFIESQGLDIADIAET